MNWEIRDHSLFGKSLFLDNGTIEVGIPLEYGLRISHFSFCGEQNVFFEQPKEMTDLTTEKGWKVRGGHRLWLAPESEKVYFPDNEPISYLFLKDDSEQRKDQIEIVQKEDPWLKVRKSMRISFVGDREVEVTNRVENTGEEELYCSLWAIQAMAPGGTEEIPFALRDGGMDHWHRVSMWDYTSLGDPRVEYRRDGITLTHQPLEEKYKIGVGHPIGPVTYKNQGVTFVKKFVVESERLYPDGDVSFETFMCKHMVEIESLSPMKRVAPGEYMEYRERWELIKS